MAALLGVFLVVVSPPASASDPDGNGAIAACRKHVESMMKEAVSTTYDGGFDVQRIDEKTLSVAGAIRSQQSTGGQTRASFRCRATRHGAALWGTRIELAIQQ